MKVIIDGSGYTPALEPLVSYRPVPLMKVLDKPVIEYIIEYLVYYGLKEFHIILSHLPDMVEKQLGRGERWGVSIEYYLSKFPEAPLKAIHPTIEHWPDEPILFVKGDTLPHFNFEGIKEHCLSFNKSIFILYSSKEWTGWALLPLHEFKQLSSHLPITLLMDAFSPQKYRTEKAHHWIHISSFQELQKSNQRILQDKNIYTYITPSAKMTEPGIWISRGVTLHPSVLIFPPVYIGENSQIKSYAHIGPHAIIERNCMIENKSLVEDTLILQHSYIGEGLEIKNSIIDRNQLIHIGHHTQVTLTDGFILTELRSPSFRQYFLKSLGRYLAFFLFVFFSPILLYFYLSKKIQKHPKVLLPTTMGKTGWKTFDLYSYSKEEQNSHPPRGFWECLPMLWNILKGELHFTGVPPRSLKEVEALPSDWQRLYLQSKAGLITLAMVEQSSSPTQDELYASETYYKVRTGLWYDICLCFRYLIKVIL